MDKHLQTTLTKKKKKTQLPHAYRWSLDSSVNIVMRLCCHDQELEFRDVLCWGLFCPAKVHSASSETGTRLFLEEKATAGVKLTAHVYAVPSFRISGAVLLLLLYTVMARTRTTVSFTVQGVVCSRYWAT